MSEQAITRIPAHRSMTNLRQLAATCESSKDMLRLLCRHIGSDTLHLITNILYPHLMGRL